MSKRIPVDRVVTVDGEQVGRMTLRHSPELEDEGFGWMLVLERVPRGRPAVGRNDLVVQNMSTCPSDEFVVAWFEAASHALGWEGAVMV